jgi:NADPH:quinone reductase-like Zn-dependent oxidoreductase
MCTPVPAATPEAVALVLSAVTACCALEETGGVKEGQSVLVTAAAGGTGHFGVQVRCWWCLAVAGALVHCSDQPTNPPTNHPCINQIAKLAGARVVAVTGSPDKVEKLKELGADLVICHTTEVRAACAATF